MADVKRVKDGLKKKKKRKRWIFGQKQNDAKVRSELLKRPCVVFSVRENVHDSDDIKRRLHSTVAMMKSRWTLKTSE